VIARLGLRQRSTYFAGSTTRKDPDALKVAPEHHGAGIWRATGSGGRRRRSGRRLFPAARGHDQRNSKQVKDEHGQCESPPGFRGTVTSSSRDPGPDSLFPGLPSSPVASWAPDAGRSQKHEARAARRAAVPETARFRATFCLDAGVRAQRRRRGGVSFHDLCHSFGTIQMAARASPKAVAEAVGHPDAGVTLRTYVHPGMDEKQRMTERMNALTASSPGVTPGTATGAEG
jgi:integrase